MLISFNRRNIYIILHMTNIMTYMLLKTIKYISVSHMTMMIQLTLLLIRHIIV